MTSTDKKEPIDRVVHFQEECDRVFETFKFKKSQFLPAWFEFEDTVEPQRELWLEVRMRIERWQAKQPSCSSFRPKVDDALEALEPFESSLVKVCDKLLKPGTLYAPREAIAESKKLKGAMNNLLKVFPSSNAEENNPPNDSQTQLIEWLPSSNLEENNLPTNSERQLVPYSPDYQLSKD